MDALFAGNQNHVMATAWQLITITPVARAQTHVESVYVDFFVVHATEVLDNSRTVGKLCIQHSRIWKSTPQNKDHLSLLDVCPVQRQLSLRDAAVIHSKCMVVPFDLNVPGQNPKSMDFYDFYEPVVARLVVKVILLQGESLRNSDDFLAVHIEVVLLANELLQGLTLVASAQIVK